MAMITISRGTFSGGKALAECLSERLGYPCLSREQVLADAAKEYGIAKKDLAAAFSEPSLLWEQVPGKRIAYLKCVTAAILQRAEQGNLVYHGHAGHVLLRGLSHVLRVRVVADMEFRIKAAMDRLNLTRDGAVAHIERIDSERRKWSRFLYGIDWEDPRLYDVVLNLERLSIGGACETIIRMTTLDEFRMSASSEKTLEDVTLSSRVWAALAQNDLTRKAAVKVFAEGGRVIIEGSVGSQKVVDAIPDVVRHVEGVKEISNDVGVGTDWYW
ncbi:MAG: cytidylate kinase family protein [Deltaproteobacteria bacterium]|nr:cytidylate kinase family protein [Deltaproteobacteria bacterium]